MPGKTGRLTKPKALTGLLQQRSKTLKRIALDLGNVVATKNTMYGDSFGYSGAFLQLLFPDGLRPDQYGDALLLVRIFDKMKRIATKKDAYGESPYQDIAGYGLLGVANDEQKPRQNPKGKQSAQSVRKTRISKR